MSSGVVPTFDFETMERPWVDLNGDGLGDPQTSCITPGTYLCEWRESPKYGWCYEVTGVKGRSHILIHPAVPEPLNLQSVQGQAKPYQVRQLVQIVERYNLHLGGET